jgi:hypothetical protein
MDKKGCFVEKAAGSEADAKDEAKDGKDVSSSNMSPVTLMPATVDDESGGSHSTQDRS